MDKINTSNIENKNLEQVLFYLERKKKYKKFNKKILSKLALKLVLFSKKTKDWRYINLALKIRDRTDKNHLLNIEITNVIKLIKKNLFKK